MRHASAFAGVDAVGLAVRALGGETVAFSEFDPSPISKKNKSPRPLEEQYNHRVLTKRLPDARPLGDVTKVDWEEVMSESPFVFASAGFPCQDLSSAGNGAGLDGARSGLYVEVIRMIREARPALALIENVPRLLGLHYERLLRDLRDSGYDCEWDVISAASVGAPHLRERLWILAYPADDSYPAPRAMGEVRKISTLSLDDDGAKWPRSGLMVSGQVFELEAIAPRKTKRIDGRSYWVGVNLLEQGASQGLWPTPEASDGTGTRVSTELGGIRPSGVKRSVTLNTAVAHGLFPTPTKQDGSNLGGPSQFERKSISLNAMAAQGLWPTPRSSHNGTETEVGGERPSGAKRAVSLNTAVNHGLFPSPLAGSNRRSQKAMLASRENGRRSGGGNSSPPGLEQVVEIADGVMPRELVGVNLSDLPEHTREMIRPLLPTPTSSDDGKTPEAHLAMKARLVGGARRQITSLSVLARAGFPDDGGRALSEELYPDQESAADARNGLWPTPRAAWNENRGTKRSPSVEEGTHGAKLAEEVAEFEVESGRDRGMLNPDWVEHLMGLPIGWTDLECDEPIYQPFDDEPLPRVIKECSHRRQRLHAVGNSLVWLIPFVILSRYRDRCGALPGEVDLGVFS